MSIIKYDKLVRDKIPEIITSKGHKPIIEYLNDQDYITKLNLKLHEELKEYDEDGSIMELADLVEVILAIVDYKKVSRDEFEEIRKKKADERGGFKDKILLKEVIEL